jgi:hypothetical protein
VEGKTSSTIQAVLAEHCDSTSGRENKLNDSSGAGRALRFEERRKKKARRFKRCWQSTAIQREVGRI